MEFKERRRFSAISTSATSHPAQTNHSRTTANHWSESQARPVTPENIVQRRPRRSSLQVSKAPVNSADYRDMANSRSSPGANILHTPQRSCSTPHYVNPSSSLLNDLIRERRAARGSRPPGADRDADIQSSPILPDNTSENTASSERSQRIRNALAIGLKDPTDMGIREMNAYVSKINKEIFDLKLEMVYRLEQVNTLTQKVEQIDSLENRIKELEATEVELLNANHELQEELEKRDRGLDEAVGLICDLENRIDELEGKTSETLSAREPYLDAALQPSSEEIHKGKDKLMIEVPDRSSSRKGTTPEMARHSRILSLQAARRQPSFLQDHSDSTTALRSLYTENANTSRPFSIFSAHETEEPTSPRLSALSECSDLDLRSSPIPHITSQPLANTRSRTIPPRLTDPEEELEGASDAFDRKLSQIQRWNPSNTIPRGPAGRYAGTPAKHPQIRSRNQPALGAAFEVKRGPKRLSTSNTNGGRLPPTPDTMSSSFIDPRNRSNPSIIEERSIYGRGNVFSSVTSDESPGEPGSAGNITTRPSTADTALIRGVESWKQRNIDAKRNPELIGLFPSTASGRISSVPPYTKLGGFDHEAHNSDSTWDCGDGSDTPTRPDLSHSLKSNLSDSVLSQLSRREMTSESLSPEDWLEAALPVEDTSSNIPSSRGSDGLEARLNSQLPPLPTARARHKKLATENARNQSRRSLASRIISGLTKSSNQESSDPPTPTDTSASTTSRSIAPRSRSVKYDSSPLSPRSPGSRPLSTVVPSEGQDARRPHKSNSMENIKHFRRGSSSIFNWLKNPKTPNAPANSPRPSSQPLDRPSSVCGRASRSNSLSNSSQRAEQSPRDGLTPPARARHPLAEEM